LVDIFSTVFSRLGFAQVFLGWGVLLISDKYLCGEREGAVLFAGVVGVAADGAADHFGVVVPMGGDFVLGLQQAVLEFLPFPSLTLDGEVHLAVVHVAICLSDGQQSGFGKGLLLLGVVNVSAALVDAATALCVLGEGEGFNFVYFAVRLFDFAGKHREDSAGAAVAVGVYLLLQFVVADPIFRAPS
jgi:hypothetical protein